MTRIWEDMISRNSGTEPDLSALGPAAEHREADSHPTDWPKFITDVDTALAADTYPIPPTNLREGYYGPHHYSYWASGLRDMQMLTGCADRNGLKIRRYFDLGCATGRVIRHFAVQRPEIKTYGADLNHSHIAWVNRHLPENIVAFAGHSIPNLPFPDNHLDLVSAYSVFTHIEAFETAWLMELRRIMAPGGLAWITIHSQLTWLDMQPHWPLHKALSNHPDFPADEDRQPMTEDRKVFRFRTDQSYTSNVFYGLDYIHRTWGRMFNILEVHRRHPGFQDVVVLQKPDET